jgi:hypothetical protein
MIWIIATLTLGLVLAAAIALIRGLVAFHNDGVRLNDVNAESDLFRGRQQNRMMAQRVLFQGLAIVMVVLLGSLAAES